MKRRNAYLIGALIAIGAFLLTTNPVCFLGGIVLSGAYGLRIGKLITGDIPTEAKA